MKLYLVLAADDPEHSYGLFERLEDAKFVCNNAPVDVDELDYREYEVDKKIEEDIYYFVVNEMDYVMDDNCFLTAEEARQYVEDNDLSDDFEIHGHKLNSMCDGNTNVDSNGEPVKPDDEDINASLYNVYHLMRDAGRNITWFDYIDIEE